MQFGRTVARFDFSLKYLPHSFARPRFEPLSFWPACLAAYLTPGPELFDSMYVHITLTVPSWYVNGTLRLLSRDGGRAMRRRGRPRAMRPPPRLSSW